MLLRNENFIDWYTIIIEYEIKILEFIWWNFNITASLHRQHCAKVVELLKTIIHRMTIYIPMIRHVNYLHREISQYGDWLIILNC